MAFAGNDGSWLQRAATRTQDIFSRRAFDGVTRLGRPRLACGPMGGDRLFRFVDMRGLEIEVVSSKQIIDSICFLLNHCFWLWGEGLIFVCLWHTGKLTEALNIYLHDQSSISYKHYSLVLKLKWQSTIDINHPYHQSPLSSKWRDRIIVECIFKCGALSLWVALFMTFPTWPQAMILLLYLSAKYALVVIENCV